jgi:uncharacterized protein with PQ loop repeat
MHFISKKLYRNLKKEQKQIDGLMWIVGIISPISGIPQVIIIYMNQSSANLSFFSWFLWFLMTIVYLLYGIVHRIKPMIFANAAWSLIYVLILIAIVLYD